MAEEIGQDQAELTMATITETIRAPATLRVSRDENSPHNGMAARLPPSTYWTVDGLLRKHASEDSDIPMVGYPMSGASDFEVHTVKSIDRYIDAACWWYQEQGLQPAVRSAPKKTLGRSNNYRTRSSRKLPWLLCSLPPGWMRSCPSSP